MSAPKYTVEPGRGIARTTDGKVLVYLQRAQEEPSKENGYVTGLHTTSPCEADDFTHVVALGLNHHEALRAALEELIRALPPSSSKTKTVLWNAEAMARAAVGAYDREKATRG